VSEKEKLLKQLDEMIQLGSSLKPYKNEYSAMQNEWETKSLRLLEKAFGRGNLYHRDFESSLNYANSEAQINEGLRTLKMARDEVVSEMTPDRLEKLEEKLRKATVEAGRRRAVAETKLWGSVIDVIDILRTELKERGKVNQRILEMRREIREIKAIMTKLNSRLDKLFETKGG